MIVVERLIVPISLEQRASQTLKQSFFSDVGIRKMNENAGLHVALGVDVEIVSAARNTAADIFGVVLEIHNEHGLAALRISDLAKPFIHLNSLLGRGNKVNNGVLADRHIVEIKSEA